MTSQSAPPPSPKQASVIDQPKGDIERLREAIQQVIALHYREVEKDALIPVEGGRATVREDIDYCAECGTTEDPCRTVEILEDALALASTPEVSH